MMISDGSGTHADSTAIRTPTPRYPVAAIVPTMRPARWARNVTIIRLRRRGRVAVGGNAGEVPVKGDGAVNIGCGVSAGKGTGPGADSRQAVIAPLMRPEP